MTDPGSRSSSASAGEGDHAQRGGGGAAPPPISHALSGAPRHLPRSAGEENKIKALIGLLARFGLAGLANTAVGFAVIAGLDLGLHVQPQLANAAGYVVGIGMGFALNRKFVFASTGRAKGEFARYLVVVAIAFVANQGVLLAAHSVLSDSKLDHLIAQFSGMATYTILTFVLSRYFVFSRASSASAAGQSASKT